MTPRARARAIYAEGEPPAEWTLADLNTTLVRRRVWIAGSVAACMAAALLYWAVSAPHYRATAVIEVEKESHGAFGLENTTADKPAAETTDTLDEALALQTEIGILGSDRVALEVIQRTGLEKTQDYFAPHRGGFAEWFAVGRKPLEPLSVPLEKAPNRRYAALRIFAAHRKIAPSSGTRLINVSYTDRDPQRAAAVANALVQALADYRFESRSSAATQSAGWLQAQLAAVKRQTDALDERAAALDRSSGEFGDTDDHNVILSRLDDLNATLSQAESSRIVREAIWQAVESGDAEAISGLGGNSASGTNTQNSFALIQSLRAQEAAAQAQLAESANRYGENWPGVAEERARLATIEKSIQDEVRRLGERAHNDYEVSVQAENEARAAFEQQKDLASRTTDQAVALRLARQEADESRVLYATLLGRLQQTGVLEGLHSGNFAVVTPALDPAPDHPSNPSLTLLMALAVGAGLAVGTCAAVVRELTDPSVTCAADLEWLLDGPVFATLRTAKTDGTWPQRLLQRRMPVTTALQTFGNYELPVPDSPFAESLHRLCASLLLSHSGNAPHVVTIASAACGAAKNGDSATTPLAFSLAAVLAQHGYPVLFVDADLRAGWTPAMSTKPPQAGLSAMLTSDAAAPPLKPFAMLPLLSVVRAGARPPCPTELIASSRMGGLLERWRHEFEFILVQSPSVVYADALVLAQLSDAVLLIAKAGTTQKCEIAPAWDSLSRQVPSHAVLGVILDGVPGGGPYATA